MLVPNVLLILLFLPFDLMELLIAPLISDSLIFLLRCLFNPTDWLFAVVALIY